MSIPTRKPRRRKRRRRFDDEDNAPPPPPGDEGWSAKKMLLVMAAVFGVPLLVLWIVVGTGAIKALGYFALGLLVIISAIFRTSLRYWWLFDDD